MCTLEQPGTNVQNAQDRSEPVSLSATRRPCSAMGRSTHCFFASYRPLLQYTKTVAVLRNGVTPLITAAQCNHLYVLESLILSGAEVNTQCSCVIDTDYGYGCTALTMAAWLDHERIVRRLLECEDIRTDVISKYSVTQGNSLYLAVTFQHDGCVLALLQSPRVFTKPEEISHLRRKMKSSAWRRGGSYSRIELMLAACQETTGTESRLARFEGAQLASFRKC